MRFAHRLEIKLPGRHEALTPRKRFEASLRLNVDRQKQVAQYARRRVQGLQPSPRCHGQRFRLCAEGGETVPQAISNGRARLPSMWQAMQVFMVKSLSLARTSRERTCPWQSSHLNLASRCGLWRKRTKVRNRESPPVCGVVFEARLTTGGDPRVEAISVALGAH